MKKPSLCLNMIVKNEARVIERCLASVKPFIDTWVIVDTGSTDGTQAIIRKFLQDIPGELHERPWVDFGHNRNEALALAKSKADNYLMFMDADDVLAIDPGYTFPPLRDGGYLIDLVDPRSQLHFPKIFLIDAHLSWRWRGVLHERLEPLDPATPIGALPHMQILYLCDGARAEDPQKFTKMVAVFLHELEKDPQDSRNMFFLAQSYRGAKQWQKALETYELRSAMQGDAEETFYALFCIAKLREHLNFPFDQVVEAYRRAYDARPARIEPLYYLANYALQRGHYTLAYEAAELATRVPPPSDLYFVELWIWQWGLWLPLADAAHARGRCEEAKQAFALFFSHPNAPAALCEKMRHMLLQNPATALYV